MGNKQATPNAESIMQISGHLVARFPERLQAIRKECEHSETFQALCEDIGVCVEALERWRQSDAPFSAARVEEYESCLAELELEIEEWLERSEETTK